MRIENFQKAILSIAEGFEGSKAYCGKCNEFVIDVYKTVGLNIPYMNANTMAQSDLFIDVVRPKISDLASWDRSDVNISGHVGIYAGPNAYKIRNTNGEPGIWSAGSKKVWLGRPGLYNNYGGSNSVVKYRRYRYLFR